ncbi:MAG: flagellin, partial [Roseibium sp.]
TATLAGFADTAGAVLSGSTTAASDTVQDLVDNLNSVAGVRAEYDESNGDLTIYSNNEFNLSDDGVANASATAVMTNGSITSAAFSTTSTLVESGGFAVGDTLTLTDGNNYELGSFEVTADSKMSELIEFMDDFQGVTATKGANGRIAITSETDLTLNSERNGGTNTDFNTVTLGTNGSSAAVDAVTDSGFATDNNINRVVDRLNNALGNLRSQASEFGTNLSTVEIRQDYTKQMINTLQEGAGKLTLADTNQEGANLLALQTRQQLASTSLSFASQADQTVLSLF